LIGLKFRIGSTAKPFNHCNFLLKQTLKKDLKQIINLIKEIILFRRLANTKLTAYKSIDVTNNIVLKYYLTSVYNI